MKKILSKIRHWFYLEFVIPAKNGWKIKRNLRKLAKAKKYADYLSKENNGKRYIVTKDIFGNYMVIDKNIFRLYKRRKRLPKNVTWEMMLQNANYITK